MSKGLHPHRFKQNPEERRFAKAWDKISAPNLVYLLDCRANREGYPPTPSDRDEEVAATVIQWLGSPVGRGFLRDLGYTKEARRGR